MFNNGGGEGSRGGKIIGHYKSGRAKYQSEYDNSNVKVAAIAGTSVGAGVHLKREYEASIIEAQAPRKRSLKAFKKMLKPGDILVAGSSAKHSAGVTFGDSIANLSPETQAKVKKAAKIFGIKGNSTFLSNATSLPIFGAGSKYHGAVYLGKGKISHMTTDEGAQIENLADLVGSNNVSALRFKDAGAKEVNKAIRYAKKAGTKHVPYQGFAEYAQNAFANYILPISKKTEKAKEFSPLVCHTLPIRAYAQRAFPLGEHTFAGDFKRVEGLSVVATRNLISAKSTSAKALIGIGGRGIKWGVAAATAAYVYNKVFGKKESEE